MELKLEQLTYQKIAINTILQIFEGQEKNTFDNSYFFEIQSNLITISQDQINENKQKIITANGISEKDAMLTNDNDYCIEMETGTGKTLVYICTIYELYKEYGLSKFIILVPSIAIKEGIINTLKTFESQLYAIYGFTPNSFEYDSRRLNRVRHFIQDTHLQIMIMTIQSFASDDRIINQAYRDDSFQGFSYLQAIGKTQPILIMDEPQEGMDTINSIERIKALNPLCKLRYSATHKILTNLLFRLTPFDAYQNGLVKKIEVLSVVEKNDEATLKIEITQVQALYGKQPKAKFNLWRSSGDNFEFKETSWLSVGDNLADRSGNISYQDFTIKRIYKSLNDGKFHVQFSNEVELTEKTHSSDIVGIFRAQLEWLIRRHFQKKVELNLRGIKCLSLIFIDRVDNYMNEKGIIKLLFAECFKKVHLEQVGKEATTEQIKAIQGYYFAKTHGGEFTDNEISMAKNKEIYDLILRDKQTLLSLANPVEFIFSHSALGVGWDNPNIFNIATLNQSFSEIKKRQEIGRGLRICVNQSGERIYDSKMTEESREINLLTIIPNETYETFVCQYQQQIKEVYGSETNGSKLRESHKGQLKGKKTLSRNDTLFNSMSFKSFWDKLAQKTDYSVVFDDERIIERAVEEINKITVPEYQADITLNRIKEIYSSEIVHQHIGSDIVRLKALFTPIDIVEELSESTCISYSSAVKIVSQINNYEEIVKNPPKFIKQAASIIKNIELEEMLRAITYTVSSERFDLNLFKNKFETFLDVLPTPQKGVYDNVAWESSFEKDFAMKAENDPEIVCFLKLPDFYEIPTPIGSYNPDFGIVLKKRKLQTNQEDELYFIIEVKGTSDINNKKSLSPSEVYKIKCAFKHFEAIGVELNLGYKPYIAPVKEYNVDFKNTI